MLLVADVGNSNTVFGLFDEDRLVGNWRVETQCLHTDDECGLVNPLLSDDTVEKPNLAVICSVVPSVTDALCAGIDRRYGFVPLIAGHTVDYGMPVLYDNPAEVGPDRVVNAVAAYARWSSGIIIVDCGTATTFDCVSPAGEYLGGAIAPGLATCAKALSERTARLPQVPLQCPTRVVGTNTLTNIQSGLVYGHASMVDGMIARMRIELGFEAPVVATGGLASLVASASTAIEDVDPLLTLKGLRLIAERR